MSELIRNLIESDQQDKNLELCDIFYDQIMEAFLERLAVKGSVDQTITTLGEVLNIMSQCIKNHSNRIRTFIIYNDVIAKVLGLLEYKNKCLNLSVCRFFRAVVERNDLQLNRFLM
jgi:protein phosphatase-4 regulatory subunit 3